MDNQEKVMASGMRREVTSIDEEQCVLGGEGALVAAPNIKGDGL